MKAANLNISGIKCDNPNCDFRDDSVDFGNYGAWLNKPCPKCGNNLFTEKDLNSLTLLINIANICNAITPDIPEDTPKASVEIEMDGTGKMDFKLIP